MADNTTMNTDGSSISHFPIFNFNLNTVASLITIFQSRKFDEPSTTVTLLLGVLEVDGPNYVTIKTGNHPGSEVGLLKLIVGDEQGAISKAVAWRETADVWGGMGNEPALKRGDIVLFERRFQAIPCFRYMFTLTLPFVLQMYLCLVLNVNKTSAMVTRNSRSLLLPILNPMPKYVTGHCPPPTRTGGCVPT